MSFIRFQEEVFEYLEGKVAKFMYPKRIKFVADLPLTPTMKVKKAALNERFTRGEKAERLLQVRIGRG